MTILALALHILGAIVWVGGMFAIYMCLRPARGTLEPPQRLRRLAARRAGAALDRGGGGADRGSRR
jgi:uncharacterized membrane protein